MKWMFFLSIFLIIYSYFLYPLILAVIGMLNRKGVRNGEENEYLPAVSIVIAAYNEEEVIRETIENKLSLDYPMDQLDIIIASDCCTDRTNDIVREFADRNVTLLRMYERRGKTTALNKAIPQAKGEIIALADGNSIWERDALRHLVQNFSNPDIGYVTGKMLYVNEDGSLIADGCTTYMKYENRLRELETRVGSIVGCDGGIDAVRKCLFEPIGKDMASDFVIPLFVVQKGYRVVYEPKAKLYEKALSDFSREFRMRVRVIVRAIHGLRTMRTLLNPFKCPMFSFQLASHKVLRYLVPELMISSFLFNLFLCRFHYLYLFCFILQTVFYLCVAVGYMAQSSGKKIKILCIPYYLFLVNFASLIAQWNYLQGQRQTIWSPRTGH